MELKQMPNKYCGLEKAEVAAWLENPVTKRAMEILDARTADLREGIVRYFMGQDLTEGEVEVGRLVKSYSVSMSAMEDARSSVFEAAVNYVR